MLNLIIFEGYTFRRAAGDFKVSLNATSLGNSKSFASAARRKLLVTVIVLGLDRPDQGLKSSVQGLYISPKTLFWQRHDSNIY